MWRNGFQPCVDFDVNFGETSSLPEGRPVTVVGLTATGFFVWHVFLTHRRFVIRALPERRPPLARVRRYFTGERQTA